MSRARGRLADLVRPGMRIALADGLGSPRSMSAELSAAAAAAGGVRLLLGWTPALDPALDLSSFADVRTFMSGWGLRSAVDAGLVHALPVRLSAVPALLHGPLRPDLLLAGVVERPDGGLAFGTEVSWMRAAVDAGARIAAVVGSRMPSSDAGPTLSFTPPAPVHRAIAEHIAALIPSGARLQVGPGALGAAVVEAVRTPVQIDSGLLADGLPGLERRRLLIGEPVGTYLAGGPELLEWADGRPLLHRVEHTHDLTRLSTGTPFVAVNTALEVDAQGQVNVEGLHAAGRAASAVGGIGGHPDYAVAGTRSAGGLSIVALPARHGAAATLVSQLSWPVTTPSSDVDVLVTEAGALDLRGLDRPERARAVAGLWEAVPVTAGSEG